MRTILYLALLLLTGTTTAAEFAPQQPVGTRFPTITAADQDGRQWTTGQLAGERGFLLFFARSTEW